MGEYQTREAMLRGMMAVRDRAMTAAQCLAEADRLGDLSKAEMQKSGVSAILQGMKADVHAGRARHYRRLAEMKAEG